MYVSVVRTKGAPDDLPEIAAIAGEEMVRWLRQIEGFDGLLMLTNEEEATTLVLSFWENREVAERHRAARQDLRDRVTTAVGVSVEEATAFDVSFCRLGSRLAELQT